MKCLGNFQTSSLLHSCLNCLYNQIWNTEKPRKNHFCKIRNGHLSESYFKICQMKVLLSINFTFPACFLIVPLDSSHVRPIATLWMWPMLSCLWWLPSPNWQAFYPSLETHLIQPLLHGSPNFLGVPLF